MEYLFDNPRTLFVLLLLTFYFSLVLSLVMVYRIIAMIKRAKRLANTPAERLKTTTSPDRNLENATICCPGGAPDAACSCQ